MLSEFKKLVVAVVIFLGLLSVSGFESPADNGLWPRFGKATAAAQSDLSQPSYRVRQDDSVALNENAGWAAGLNDPAVIDAENPFRIRFEVEEDGGSSFRGGFQLQWRRAGGSWNNAQAYDPPSASAIGAVGIVVSEQYADGNATSDLLPGSSAPFVAGSGEENATTGAISLSGEHTELEWTIVIHTFYDGAQQNVGGDTFEFRVVESGGSTFSGSYAIAEVILDVPDGLIGGTYVENPNRIGPFMDSNGNLYAIIEPSETDPLFLMIRSTDGGRSWSEVDGGNRPSNGDLEGVDAVQDGDTLHIVHHPGKDVFYHRFHMSDHSSTPDRWAITDETVAPNISETDQAAALEVRSDGTIVAFYRRTDGSQRIKYRIRSAGGGWGSEQNLDASAGSTTWVTVVRGKDDKLHIFYQDEDAPALYHRSLDHNDSLSSRQTVTRDIGTSSSEAMSVTQPVFWESNGHEKIMVGFKADSDDRFYTSVVTDDGAPSTPVAASDSAVDYNAMSTGASRAPAASLAVDGSNVYLLYAQNSNSDIYSDINPDDTGWGSDVREIADVTGHWIRSNVYDNGNRVVGAIWDNGSAGWTGYVRYDEFEAVDPGSPGNRSPSVNVGPNLAVTLPDGVSINATVSDDGLPDGSLDYLWDQQSGPGDALFSSTDGEDTTVTFTTAGTYRLRLTVSDGELENYDELEVIVYPIPPANVAPTVNVGPDLTVTLPDSASINASVSDDGQPGGALVHSWIQVSGPDTAIFAPSDAKGTTVTFPTAGAYRLRLTVSDGELENSDELVVTVESAPPINEAPAVDVGSDKAVTLPDGVSINANVSDDGLPDGSLTYSWDQRSGPGDALFVSANSEDTTVTFSTAGTYRLRLTVSDGDLQNSDELNVIAEPAPPVNQAPAVNVGLDQTVMLPGGAVINASVADDGLPNGTLDHAWTQVDGPGTAIFAPSDAEDTNVSFATAGTYRLRLTVSDGELENYDELEVTVEPAPPANVAPTVNAGPDQTVTLPNVADISAAVSDDGLPGDSLVYAWTQIDGPGTATFVPSDAGDTSVIFPESGLYRLRLTVSDGDLQHYDELAVTVEPAPPGNQRPVVVAGENLAVILPDQAVIDAVVVDDGLPDGLLTYAWTQVSGPDAARFTPPDAADTAVTFPVSGTYRLNLAVSDGELQGSDDITVTVVTNQAPVVAAGPDQTITLPAQAVVDATVSDDGLRDGTLTYAWTQISGPDTALLAPPDAEDIAVSFPMAGTYLLRLIVSDGELHGSDDVAIEVEPIPLNMTHHVFLPMVPVQP